MLFSSSFDRRKVNPLIYVKFWRQACLPTLLYDAELFTLTLTSLLSLERCQSWFLKNIFYVPKFAPGPLLLALSCLNSVESEIATRRLLLLGRLINEPKMFPAVKACSTAERKASLTQISHQWVFCPGLQRHCTNMRYFIASKIGITARHSRFILPGKKLCGLRSVILRHLEHAWDSFCKSHPNMRVVQSCLENLSSFRFWSLANQFPDLVSRMHMAYSGEAHGQF